MKYEILLKMLFDLLSKKSASATYFAEKYGISTRTVYRYIDCLEAAGVPIYTISGKYGGFAIMDTFKFSSTFMTEPEFNETIKALTAIVNSVPDKTLSSALDKLKSAVKNEYSGFDVKSGNLIIDAGPWGDTVGYKSKLAVITKSTEECKALLIRYHDRNGEITERTVEPHVIVFKQGIWYVYAYCRLRGKFRFFKIGRIESATVTAEKFVKRNLSDMDLPLDFWHNSVKAERVELEINKSVLSDAEEWLGIENIEQKDGKFIANAALPFDNGLVSKIMSFGKGIKVLYPAELKKRITENAAELLKLYE